MKKGIKGRGKKENEIAQLTSVLTQVPFFCVVLPTFQTHPSSSSERGNACSSTMRSEVEEAGEEGAGAVESMEGQRSTTAWSSFMGSKNEVTEA